MNDTEQKLDKISAVLDRVLSEQAKLQKAQTDNNSLQASTRLEIKSLSDEQRAMWGDVRRIEIGQDGIQEKVGSIQKDVATVQKEVHKTGVLVEDLHDNVTKLADAVYAQGEIIQTLATKEDLKEVKADIQTIKLAVKATNQDLTETKRVFGHLKTT